MRTTLDINEKLLRLVMSLSRARTKKEAVDMSLLAYIRQKRLERLAGRLGKGTLSLSAKDLDELRSR